MSLTSFAFVSGLAIVAVALLGGSVLLTRRRLVLWVSIAITALLAALEGRHARDEASHRTAARLVAHARATAELPGHGVVLSLNVPASHSGFHARAPFVYLPPAWFATPRPALPVVVLIAGSPGTP